MTIESETNNIKKSLHELNKKFGEHGKTFSTLEDAENYAANFKYPIITPIVDYHDRDFELKAKGIRVRHVVKKGAKPHVVAYLVDTCTHRPQPMIK